LCLFFQSPVLAFSFFLFPRLAARFSGASPHFLPVDEAPSITRVPEPVFPPLFHSLPPFSDISGSSQMTSLQGSPLGGSGEPYGEGWSGPFSEIFVYYLSNLDPFIKAALRALIPSPCRTNLFANSSISSSWSFVQRLLRRSLL